MAFDLASAKPIQEKSGFDLSTAKPVANDSAFQDEQSMTAGELASGVFSVAGVGAANVGKTALEGSLALSGQIARPLIPVANNIARNFGFDGRMKDIKVDDSLKAAEALTDKLPSVEINEDGERLITMLSEKYQTAPELLKNIVNDFVNMGENFGETAFNAVEDLPIPAEAKGAVAATARVLPDALEAATGFTGGKIAVDALQPKLTALKSRSPVVSEYIEEVLTTPAEQARSIKSPRYESVKKANARQGIIDGTIEGAGWRIDKKSGKVIPDRLGRDLIKQGVSEKLIVAPNRMTAGDREAASKMIESAENFIRGVKGSERNIPQSVIGENAMKRFKTIINAQREASKRIGAAVESDLKGKSIDIQEIVDDFDNNLYELGVRVVDADQLDFSNSLIQRSNTTPISDVYARLKTSYDDASELHELKRYISKQIDYDKKAPLVASLDDEAETALKAVRSKINERLKAMSDDYTKANEDFAMAAETIVPFAKEMGRRFDPQSGRVESLVGQELRKTITNYAKANDLIEALDNLDSTARKFGGEFDDDIMTQIMFNSELERVFGSFKPNSMQGVMEKGAGVALDRAGVTGQAVQFGLNAVKDRIYVPPSEEKLRLARQLKELVNR